MAPNAISKVLEIDNCNKEILSQAIFKAEFWKKVSPVTHIEVDFISPNVFYSKITDDVKITGNLLKIPITMEGDLVLMDRGEEDKGKLFEFNVRNNKDVKELDGNLRIKTINPMRTKVGIFIHNFELSSDFLNLIGKGAWEMILRTKITDLLRNVENYCKKNKLEDLIK